MSGAALPPVSQLVRFVIAGTVNTAFSYGVYALFLWLGLSYPLANLASMILGVMLGFVTQGHFVFRKMETRRFPRFVASWLVMWAVNVAVIAALMPVVNHNAYVAGALALCVIVPLSFVVQRHLVFGGGSGR
jgi:putative flippase GtrA